MLTTIELLKEIDKFLRETGMSDGAFSRAAVGNGKFLGRLRDGVRKGTGDVKLVRANQIMEFMEARRREAAE